MEDETSDLTIKNENLKQSLEQLKVNVCIYRSLCVVSFSFSIAMPVSTKKTHDMVKKIMINLKNDEISFCAM